ncbi:MAG TPA: ribonuclease Z [Pyrinomonadaceae bacterium]|jgi:ribonuclease BN (tRNA processing enzyme)|nr:ribonuclease Z [Pyrinomonadaceae bacterium]
MQLIVLGSGTSVFHAQRAAAGFWLQTELGSILLDCSADAPHRMAQENLDWSNLDTIWISHLHLDHCAGLAPFLFGLKWAKDIDKRSKPLRIVGCVGIRKLLEAIDASHHYKLFEQLFEIEIEEVESTREARSVQLLGGLQAKTISTPHRHESLALRITDSAGVTVVYTSDTGFSEAVAGFAHDADLLILECSFYQNKPTPKHLELGDAMSIAQLARPKKLLLTHLYAQWDDVDLEAETTKLWPGETIAARDGLKLEVG